MAVYKQYNNSSIGTHPAQTPPPPAPPSAKRDHASLCLVSQRWSTKDGEYVADEKNPRRDFENPVEALTAFATLWIERIKAGKNDDGRDLRRVFLQIDNPSTLAPAERQGFADLVRDFVLPEAPHGFEWVQSGLVNKLNELVDSVSLRPARLPVRLVGKGDVEELKALSASLMARQASVS